MRRAARNSCSGRLADDRPMYADDTQLYDSSSLADAESVRDRLTSCVSEVAK